jgi:hypothetical protein
VGPGFLAQLYGNLQSALVLTATAQAMVRVRLAAPVAAYVNVDVTALGTPIVDTWKGYGFAIPNAGLTFFF